MNSSSPLLLPSGLYDLLPPDARTESDAVQRLLASFASFGYAQVSPPLLEFEASLLSGRGEALAPRTFRVMDPLSQNMMGLRADMTMQVARIAGSRLGSHPRPLRLCYAGPILQTRPDALKNERQLTQAGIELIGSNAPAADAEVMIVAAESLLALGAGNISIDINLPGLLGELCPEAAENAGLRAQLKDAVQRRDARALTGLKLKNGALLAELLETAGTASKALAAMKKHDIAHACSLETALSQVTRACPGVAITLDPLEYRGFDYHSGIGFSIFAQGLRHELARGGRYMAANETATGFTLYVTHLLKLLKPLEKQKCVLLPNGADPEAARALRAQGWATVGAMTDNPRGEARNLGIGNVWNGRGMDEDADF